MDHKLLSSISFKQHPFNLPAASNDSAASMTKDLAEVLPRQCIKLLTYNMFMRPPPVKTNASDFKDARLDEFVKKLDDFDIICHQEVFSTLNTRKQRLITYAKKAGLTYHAVNDPPGLFSGYATDGGLLILSRFPIIESEFEPYDYGVVSDALSYKGVLYVKILI